MTPEDRAKAVHAAIGAALSGSHESRWVDEIWQSGTAERMIADAICRAIEAERERCAAIAGAVFMEHGPPVAPIGTSLAVKRAAGAEIADRIRGDK